VETILPESNPRTDPTAAILPDHFSADANQAHETKHEHEAKLGHESPAVPMASVAPAQRLDARLLGFFVLEFGVIFHSVIIGLTLSTTGADFITLFVVIIFHQMFEGLGLGSRLAILPFKKRSIWPWVLGIIYGFVTPLGMAIGLGLRTTYDSSSQTALIVSGTLDAISSGILLYTGLVELLAHEFLFSRGNERCLWVANWQR
jgi:zinc transporter 1/2/3